MLRSVLENGSEDGSAYWKFYCPVCTRGRAKVACRSVFINTVHEEPGRGGFEDEKVTVDEEEVVKSLAMASHKRESALSAEERGAKDILRDQAGCNVCEDSVIGGPHRASKHLMIGVFHN